MSTLGQHPGSNPALTISIRTPSVSTLLGKIVAKHPSLAELKLTGLVFGDELL